MTGGTAAHRYAKALFGLAQDEHRHREVREEIENLGRLFDDEPRAARHAADAASSRRQRKRALARVASRALSPLVQNFLSYLIDQRRLIDFARSSPPTASFADDAEGLVTAEVVAASPLDDRRKDRLRRALSERTGQEVRLEIEVDPSLIGGAIAKVGDLVFDGSLRTQLGQLRANLTRSK